MTGTYDNIIDRVYTMCIVVVTIELLLGYNLTDANDMNSQYDMPSYRHLTKYVCNIYS